MGDFRNLSVWQKSHKIALASHRLAARMRGNSYASLRSQLVRSAMSIATNIVEGSAKRSDKEFARFLKISLGSASELEYHLIVAHDLGAVEDRHFLAFNKRIVEVRKMLSGLIDSLEGE